MNGVICNQLPVNVETREDGRQVIVGYASVFFNAGDSGTEFQLAPKVRERIMPTAFNRALSENQDVRALFNHDPAHLLGRRGSGTLRLSVDHIGLRYEIDPPDTQAGRDTLESIRRGDLAGSSFAFILKRHRWERGADFDVRNIEDVDLLDVGPVTFPAYKSATTGLRSEDAERDRQEWLRQQEAEGIAVTARLRDLENAC